MNYESQYLGEDSSSSSTFGTIVTTAGDLLTALWASDDAETAKDTQKIVVAGEVEQAKILSATELKKLEYEKEMSQQNTKLLIGALASFSVLTLVGIMVFKK